ncbi:hypothetical protein B0H14DRAFT_2621448 [Mycena olivaceomarginata]|nr:hypothetical protein B0H14DRAFT_2621448 [Mycena olivaceomarginata]
MVPIWVPPSCGRPQVNHSLELGVEGSPTHFDHAVVELVSSDEIIYISDALANSCGSIVAILATNAADHPIVVDYDSWMENQSKVVKSADKFVSSPLSDAPMDVDPVESNIEAQFEEHRGEKRRREETLGDDEVPEPRSSKIAKVILSLCISINVSQMSPQAVIGLNWAERANLAVSKDAEAAVPAKPRQP